MRTIGSMVLMGLAGALALATPGAAEEWRLVLDPERTEITFELGATLHSVHGAARLRQGEIVFESGGGAAEGSVVVAAESADTGNERRDRDMHAKVLESQQFPEIAFRPDEVIGEVSPAGRSEIEIAGTFSIHGSDHPVRVEAVVDISGSELEATLELEVPYVAWGMKDPSKLLLKVSKEVVVRIHAFGTVTPP